MDVPDPVPFTEDGLEKWGFPDECIICGETSVYPMGATVELDGNVRECFNEDCGKRWVVQ